MDSFHRANYLAAHTLGGEVLDPLMSKRGLGYDAQEEFLRRHRSSVVGFAAPFCLLLAIPFVGALLFALAQAAVAVLVVDVLEPADDTAA